MILRVFFREVFMGLTGVDKIKLNKYIREHAIDDIFYTDMCVFLGKKGKITDSEFIDYFADYSHC